MNIISLMPRNVPDSMGIEVPVADVNQATALPPVKFVGGEQLRCSTVLPKPWLWQGYVAKGSMTLLTSLWKSGKTTLICHLLNAIRRGDTTFLGQKLDARKIAVVSEEGDFLWVERSRRFGYTDAIQLAMRPFAGKPDPSLWHQFVGQLFRLCKQQDIAFVVIDPIANFIPGEENDADSMIRFLAPLTHLTKADIGVMLLHHPRKRGGGEGTASRGSGALTGFVDVILEMKRPLGDAASRARIIEGFSRFQETPAELTIELMADGSAYRVVANPQDLRQEAIARTAFAVVRDSDQALMADEIIQCWPEDKAAPSINVLKKSLKQLCPAFLTVEGRGTKCNPYRYRVANRAVSP